MDPLMNGFRFIKGIALGFSLSATVALGADGFVSLFNGKDLTGWTTVGTEGSFSVKKGAIRTTGVHPYPAWLRSDKQYENFVLRFSFKPEGGWYEGGVFIHAPAQGPGADIGFRIHTSHSPTPYGTHSMGAIYNVATPLAFPGFSPKKWNKFEVTCQWPILKITLNGMLIHNIDMSKDPAWKHRLRKGFIGIDHISNAKGLYKDIEIKELPGKQKWVSLFTAPDCLKITGKSKWTYDAKTQTFLAVGKNSMAYTKQEIKAPYELQVWVKTITPNENGGVIFNASPSTKQHGPEAQCFSVPGATNPTGSLYHIDSAKKVITRDNEWFLLQLFNEGAHVTVYINGQKMSETKNMKPPYKGVFGFQQHTPNGKIKYRGARVRSLK